MNKTELGLSQWCIKLCFSRFQVLFLFLDLNWFLMHEHCSPDVLLYQWSFALRGMETCRVTVLCGLSLPRWIVQSKWSRQTARAEGVRDTCPHPEPQHLSKQHLHCAQTPHTPPKMSVLTSQLVKHWAIKCSKQVNEWKEIITISHFSGPCQCSCFDQVTKSWY